jgi:hypothetical protein
MALVLSISGEDKTSILKARTLNIKRRAEGRNECGFSLAMPYASYNPPIGAEVVVSSDGQVIFGGVVKERRIQRLNSKGVMYCLIRIFCQGYNHIPKRRTIQYNPDNITAGAAIRHMLETVLYQEGIQEGVIEDGIVLHNYNAYCRSVRDILDDLAEACGFKWYIDEQKLLYFLREDEIRNAPYSIIENGSFTDFGEVEVEDSLEGYRNKQFVKSGDIVAVVENSDEIASRIAIEGGTGVYGDVLENTTVQTTEDAENLANDLLNRYGQHVPAALSFSTFTSGFDAGQRLEVNLPSLGASGSYLIEEMGISDVGNGVLKYSIDAVKKNFDKTSKRKANWIDFFQGLVKGGSQGSDALEGVQTYVNKEVLSISGNQVEGMKITASTSRSAHLHAGFTLTGSATADNMLLTAVLECGGKTQRTYKQALKVGYNTVSATTVITAVQAGTVTVRLLLSCEGGTFNVEASCHDGYIRAVGLADTSTRLPEAFVTLKLTRENVPAVALFYNIQSDLPLEKAHGEQVGFAPEVGTQVSILLG